MASTGEVWRLGHRPALDGLRGIAIVLVLLTHTRTPGFETAGAVGVTVFFTLSGFLITSLLLEERASTGRVSLVAFYRRRARRLFPALAAVSVVVAAIWILVPGFVEAPVLLGAITYSTNWVLAGGGYGFGGGALAHTWSLAIEEQFYLVWPVVMLALVRLPRRWMLGLIGVGCLACLTWRSVLLADGASVFRLYYASDARADNLLIGCGLAVLLHATRPRFSGRALIPVGLAALACLVFVPGPAVFALVPTAVSLATAVTIYGAATGARVGWLSWSPLRLLGRRSYGLYLWHVPVGVLVSMQLGSSPEVAWLVTVPLAWGLTLLSWRYVEQPFLRYRSAHQARPATRRPVHGAVSHGARDAADATPAAAVQLA